MVRCNATLKIDDDDCYKIVFQCQLDKHSKGKHMFDGISKGKLFKIEWWDELPVIEGTAEMYIGKGGVKE